jgi:hypothetical protein
MMNDEAALPGRPATYTTCDHDTNRIGAESIGLTQRLHPLTGETYWDVELTPDELRCLVTGCVAVDRAVSAHSGRLARPEVRVEPPKRARR